MFNNIYEEERLFPYLNISLEEARRLRYLISNFYAFKDGDLILIPHLQVGQTPLRQSARFQLAAHDQNLLLADGTKASSLHPY